MSKNWNIHDSNLVLQNDLSRHFSIDPIIAQLLINRNITDFEDVQCFLNPSEDQLHDPFLYKGMRETCDRIKLAAANDEKVLILGDYDVDGVTSTTVLYKILQRLGVTVLTYLPHRMVDGYGFSSRVIRYAEDNGVSLVITVDCGITAVEEVKALHLMGIEVVILDHHEPDDSIGVPDAFSVVDAKQKECGYPFKSLATVGMMVKLSQALLGEVCYDCLDFVALGTIADMVPLRGENRILVKMGLPCISSTKHIGLWALLQETKIKDKAITSYHIGFVLGPRINAAGRMDSACKALELFLEDDKTKALDRVKTLEGYNLSRQRIQRTVVNEAMAIIEEENLLEHQKILVLNHKGWHKGVIGIVAARIKDKYYRPVIIISIDENGVGTASCRSIQGFCLYSALAKCSQYLESFGGHSMAAGFTIKEDNIGSFIEGINDVASDELVDKRLEPILNIDCEISLDVISLDFIKRMMVLEPYGQGNPSPCFCMHGVTVNSSPQVLGRNTIKFWVSNGQCSLSAVGFGMGDCVQDLYKGKVIDIAFELSIDDWNKSPVPQILLKDIKVELSNKV